MITITTVVTAADRLTGTNVFPFDGQQLVPLVATATTGTLTLNEPDQPPVQWSGAIASETPLIVQWTARATQPLTLAITALTHTTGIFPIRSNTLNLAILPGLRRLFLPIVLKMN